MLGVKPPKNISEAVYAAVCWFDVFATAASLEEIHRYIFFRKATLREVKQVLEKDKRFGSSFGFYFLKGRNALVLKRCQHQYHSGKLWNKVVEKSSLFTRIPFLKLVAVGNTLAMGWPDSESDIDLLVVAENKRLFTTRALLTFFMHLRRMRRHGKKIAGRFCLSFFLAENAMNLESLKIGKFDPYLAFWLATLTPTWGNGIEKLLKANPWVKEYFPNFKREFKKSKHEKTGLEKLLAGKLGDLLEKRLRNHQLKRANKKKRKNYAEKTSVIISPTVLKFHEKDRRREYLEAFEKRLSGSAARK
jgi:hypothetical protein